MPSLQIYSKFWYLLLCLSIYPSILNAQKSDSLKSPFGIGIKSGYGFIIPHSADLKPIANSNPWSLVLDFNWQLIGEKTYQTFAGYPRVGAEIQYINFANPAELGYSLAVVAYCEPYLAIQNRLNASFRFGMGFAYLNRVYDPETNPRNLFYSANLSFPLTFQFHLNYRLKPSLGLRLGASFNHISNGGQKNPNKGINYPMAYLGLEYIPKPINFKLRPKIPWRELHPKLTVFQIGLLATAKPVDKEQPEKYPILGLNASLTRIVSRMIGFSGGVEWVINQAVQERLRRNEQAGHPHQVALITGHHLLLGKFDFSQQFGLYILRADKSNDALYQRYGLTFSFAKN
jgi:Lipid A 3-O-deacylase (PagL)